MAALKKGLLVRILVEKLQNSVEIQASDSCLPRYISEGTAEVLDLKGDYVLIKFTVPTPNVWLHQDQLELAA